MAPMKRKRREGDLGDGRPSPHRPQNMAAGQHDRGAELREGNRRSSRGGQGGMGGRGRGRRNDGRDNPNDLNISATGRATPTPGISAPAPRPSSATQTPVQTPTPTADIPSPIPKRDPAPFDYEVLTEERLSTWANGGRQEVVEHGVSARADEDEVEIGSVLQELVRATLDGRLDAADAGLCVKEILGPDTAAEDGEPSMFDPQTAFLDILSMLYDAEEGPLNPALRVFAIATGISPLIMRQKLDGRLLQDLGLTRETFQRVGVRQATNLLYRQANYNLLREESEGYSKLVTELFSTSGSEPPYSEVVEDAFERVKGLIGTFDLDVGRVLDITLDVFAAVLIKHFRFFIKLLRVSSWWPRSVEIDGIPVSRCGGLPNWALPTSQGFMPEKDDEDIAKAQRSIRDTKFWARAREVGLDAFFELGGRELVDEDTKRRIVDSKQDVDADLDAERQWVETTGTFPPSGNRVAAQLLGFKLRFYTSTARDIKDDILPQNLLYLTALLIKVGFISLRDLYAHLWPLDEDMPKVRETRRKELEEKERLNRGGGAANALTMAGALPDDTIPNNGRTRETIAKPDVTAKVTESEEKKDEPADQKVLLLTCLLTIGAIPEALFILGRFPWLPEAYPDLIDLINRILHHSLKDVYELSRPISSTENPNCTTAKYADLDQTGVPKGQVRLMKISTKKQLRWPFPDTSDTNDALSYRFYWDEWADNVPVCQNVDDVFTLCSTFLNLAGVSIGKDAALLSKLTRIGVKSLTDDPSQQNLDRWQDLLKRLLVPALSLTKSNTSAVNEIYDMLRFYPVSIRYSIYAEWFEGTVSRLPAIKSAFARAKHETERTMKRISLTNLPTMARALAKIAYWCPGVVFRIALSQIEAYSNLTEVVVECAKYFTDLGYDVLVWSLLSSLGGKERNRNNAEFALLPSRWLLALSRFSGKVFRRYSIMNLSPIIQYVNDQLYRGNSTDLVILKELIAQMAGVVPDTDFNDSQLLAMTGGEALRKQTLINLQDKRYESVKTAKRLMRGLTETKLAGELLISMAQHRQSAIYKIADEEAHIKMIATMIDDTQLILFQYLDLLRSNLSPEEFDKQVPGIPELLLDFGLEPSLAFLIGRAGLAYRRSIIPIPTLNSTKALPAATELVVTDVDGDVGMGDVNPAAVPNNEKTTPPPGDNATGEDVPMVEPEQGSPSQLASPETTPTRVVDEFHDMMEPIVAAVQQVLPKGSFKSLTPEFYAFFWSCSLGDLAIPSSSYDSEINRLAAKESEKQIFDRNDSSRAVAIARKEREDAKKVYAETRQSLLSEFRRSVFEFGKRKSRLLRNKAQWFDKPVKADVMSVEFLEKCLLPRMLFSPSDADYSFKMMKFLHDNGVPQFRLLSVYGQIFKANRLRSIIFTCTVREAENFGRFLRLALTDLARWHADIKVYEREAWGVNKNLPGFAKALDEEGKPKGWLDHDGNKGFKSVLYHWHKNLNTALRDCFEGTEWMHIRNAITILKSVVEVFPAVDFMGNSFVKQLEAITKREKGAREDLSLTGNAVLVQLKKRSRNWVMVQAFGHILIDSSQTNGNTGKSSSPAANPRSALKPTAPEFKPTSRASSLGISTSKPTTHEVEDGEVTATPTTAGPGKIPTPLQPVSDIKSTIQVPTPAASTVTESKKSDILDRREQFKRENAGKAAASTPPHPAVPPRPDSLPRPDSGRLINLILDRGSPSLPNRPEGPFPPRDLIDRHSSRHGDRRDPRLPEPRNLDRVGPRPGDRGRDFSGSDRRGVEPNPRDFARTNDRSSGADREQRIRDPPPRWTGESARDTADKLNTSRAVESGRLSREVPPPRSSGVQADRGPLIHPDRQPVVNQEMINPERAAFISAEKDLPRSDSPRRGREDARDRGTTRTQSPRRNAMDKDHADPRREDRRNGPADTYGSSRGRPEEIIPPPAGPRSDRGTDRERINGSERNAFQPSQPPPRPMDLNHGRLNPAPRQQPDPNFGRLNPDPAPPEIPLGPRDRNSRGNRPLPSGNTGLAPRGDTRDRPRAPSPDNKPPTGPAGGRNPRRSASGQFDTNGPPLNTPAMNTSAMNAPPMTTPVAAPVPSAIHPDRLAKLGVIPQTPPQPQNTPPAHPTGVHPDRMKAFGNDTPVRAAPHMNNNRARPQPPPPPPVVTNGPPSGPKGSQPSPIMPNVNGFAAPTGPASSNERAVRGGGGRRQLAGINNMLQQAGQPHNTPDRARGRGRLSTNTDPQTPISGPPTPIVPPPPPMVPAPVVRHEAARDISNMNPERADLITGGASAPDDRDRERSGRRDGRSGRHSRRGSRSPGRERDSKHVLSDDRASRGEYRDRSDRRGGDFERESRHRAASPSKDLLASREPSGRDNGRDRDRERERENGSGRRDGRERENAREVIDPYPAAERGDSGRERGAERGGRPRDVRESARGEDRRDSRGTRGEDGGSGRKRRGDGDAPDSRGHDKRARR